MTLELDEQELIKAYERDINDKKEIKALLEDTIQVISKIRHNGDTLTIYNEIDAMINKLDMEIVTIAKEQLEWKQLIQDYGGGEV